MSAYAERCGWTDLWPIQTAVSEAVGNAVVHAYPTRTNGTQVWVSAELDPEGCWSRSRTRAPGCARAWTARASASASR